MSLPGGSDPSQCLKHSVKYRGLLQQVMNRLRENLPANSVSVTQVDAAICVCRDSPECIMEQCNPHTLSAYYSAASVPKYLAAVPLVQQTVEHILLNQSGAEKVGHLRLAFVLQQIIEQRFDMFCVRPKARSVEPSTVTTTFDLFIESVGYLGYLIGGKGKHLQPLRDRYKCEIQINEERSVEVLTTGVVKVTVTAATLDTVDKVKVELENLAAETVKKRKKHHLKVQAFREFLRIKHHKYWTAKRQSAARGASEAEGSVDHEVFKFGVSSKRSKDVLKKHTGPKNHPVRPKPPPVLTNSRCINCLLAYKPGHVHSAKSCRYHAGYIVKRDGEWSCCHLETESTQPSVEDHIETGCQVGCHNWRPTQHSPAGRKDRSNMRHLTMSHYNDKKPASGQSPNTKLSALSSESMESLRDQMQAATLVDYFPDKKEADPDLKDFVVVSPADTLSAASHSSAGDSSCPVINTDHTMDRNPAGDAMDRH